MKMSESIGIERRHERAENEGDGDVNPTHKRERMHVVFLSGYAVGVRRDFLRHIVYRVFFALASAIAFAERRGDVRDEVKHIVCALLLVLFEFFEFHKFPYIVRFCAPL